MNFESTIGKSLPQQDHQLVLDRINKSYYESGNNFFSSNLNPFQQSYSCLYDKLSTMDKEIEFLSAQMNGEELPDEVIQVRSDLDIRMLPNCMKHEVLADPDLFEMHQKSQISGWGVDREQMANYYPFAKDTISNYEEEDEDEILMSPATERFTDVDLCLIHAARQTIKQTVMNRYLYGGTDPTSYDVSDEVYDVII